MQRLEDKEVKEIGLRQNRMEMIMFDLSIHKQSLQDFVKSLIKKYKLDIKKQYQLDGNYLTELKETNGNNKSKPEDKSKGQN